MGGRWKRIQKKHRPKVSRYYSRPLSPDDPDRSVNGFRFVEADHDNLARLKASFPKELSDRKRDILAQRIQDPSEDAWMILDEGDRLCGFACLAWDDHEVKLMQHTIRVRPHQALFMDDYVFKKHRRRGAQSAAVELRVGLAAAHGRTEGLVLVSTTNLGSISSYRKAGFQTCGRLIHFPTSKRTLEFWIPRPLRHG
ncbi:acetyltransferase (GNAT) family protein [Ornithinicoccus hortensis]|uniref:Acetyltransferase (GNAT) family protein n=1 Tax=Ornithinicoccus hortensis TaxID=82346 RepID=A0A542YLT6_9MICO|nr:acetyltransferase (GNAT) family protein [Ornithinicoccus hortensis]